MPVVTSIHSQSPQHSYPHLAEALDENYPDSDSDLPLRYKYAWHHMNRGRYAERALIDGRMYCVDPCSGDAVVACRSWVLPLEWLCIAYDFQGVDRFVLITSSFDQAKLGIYFPKVDHFVLANVDEGWRTIAVSACNKLRIELTSGAESKDKNALANGSKSKCSLHLGFVGNVGHYIWNDLSGIELALTGGGGQKYLFGGGRSA